MGARLLVLQWLSSDDSLPDPHRQVSFPELALDFESHAGRHHR